MSVEQASPPDPEVERLRALELLHDHAVRSVDRQASVLGELRTRASVILSASGIVASVLGGHALRETYNRTLVALATLALAVGLGLCIGVLRSVRDTARNVKGGGEGHLPAAGDRPWRVTVGPRALRELMNGEGSREDILRSITHALIGASQENFKTIRRRTRLFDVACLCLFFQLSLWGLAFVYK